MDKYKLRRDWLDYNTVRKNLAGALHLNLNASQQYNIHAVTANTILGFINAIYVERLKYLG